MVKMQANYFLHLKLHHYTRSCFVSSFSHSFWPQSSLFTLWHNCMHLVRTLKVSKAPRPHSLTHHLRVQQSRPQSKLAIILKTRFGLAFSWFVWKWMRRELIQYGTPPLLPSSSLSTSSTVWISLNLSPPSSCVSTPWQGRGGELVMREEGRVGGWMVDNRQAILSHRVFFTHHIGNILNYTNTCI